jgi:5-formyltetrahydrofolate cyclo-ligase
VTESVIDAASLAAKKEDLRRRLHEARRALAPAEVDLRTAAAVRRLAELPALAGARTVALFAGLEVERELDPRELDPLLRERGVRTVYPRVAARKPPTLSFHAVEALDALVPGPLGVAQPPLNAEQVSLDEIDAFVVPGLGFTEAGARIGFGAGYYDATLAAVPRAIRIGLCHPEQLIDELPESPRDQRVDQIVTPDRSFSCTPGRRAQSGDRP